MSTHFRGGSRMRSTYTYALLEVSPAAYDEVARLLRAVGYGDVIQPEGEIDMHGLALVKAALAVDGKTPAY